MTEPDIPHRHEIVYRTIRLVMLGDIMLGLVLLVLGLFIFDAPALAVGGTILACMGLGLALIYRMLGRRLAASGSEAGPPTGPCEGPHQPRG